jgi:biopolymer transport protein ExbB
MHRFLLPIHTLSSILPLLGLLGTINGMIKVFEVITVFGVGNARGMAAGISEALITTMAGLVTALSGLYFCVNLQSLTERASDHFAGRLSRDAHIKGGSK